MIKMVKEATEFLNLPVYTRHGIYVGDVRNVALNTEEQRVDSLIITDTNPDLVEGSRDVGVPYRWVSAAGDIIILSHFPERVCTEEEEEAEA
ncbi:MAG TPA: photosystem reaction center subunit H [Thermoplasmatales archaeon]|nr:photosystem reaction center subunit H [Thermoplasmatales archaeon]